MTGEATKRETTWPAVICVCALAIVSILAPSQSRALDIPESGELEIELSARAAAHRTVEIIPQIEGTVVFAIERIGQPVNKGDVLVRLDPAPYQAALDRARAVRQIASTRVKTIRAEVERITGLVEKKLVPNSDLYTLALALNLAEGAEQQAVAQERIAALELADTTITSPINGFVSSINVDLGDTLEPSDPPVMVVLNYDPVDVFFDIEQGMDNLIYRSMLAGELALAELWLKFADGTQYEPRGTYIGSSHQINPQTGNIVHQAQFPNPYRLIAPGLATTIVLRFRPQGDCSAEQDTMPSFKLC